MSNTRKLPITEEEELAEIAKRSPRRSLSVRDKYALSAYILGVEPEVAFILSHPGLPARATKFDQSIKDATVRFFERDEVVEYLKSSEARGALKEQQAELERRGYELSKKEEEDESPEGKSGLSKEDMIRLMEKRLADDPQDNDAAKLLADLQHWKKGEKEVDEDNRKVFFFPMKCSDCIHYGRECVGCFPQLGKFFEGQNSE